MLNGKTFVRTAMMALGASILAMVGCGGGGTPAPPTPVATLDSISLNPATVVSPNPVQGTVTLTAPAPTGGANVTLSSNNAAATVPASVLVAAGARSMGFNVTTSGSGTATISGTYGGVTRTAQLTVNPALVANFTVTSTAAARRVVNGTAQDIAGLGVGTADVCPLVAGSGSARSLGCVFNGSASTVVGSSITQYRWTYKFGTQDVTETSITPTLTPTTRDCGFFGNGQFGSSQGGGLTFINMIVELRVVNAQGTVSDVKQNQNVRIFPGGNCGYAF